MWKSARIVPADDPLDITPPRPAFGAARPIHASGEDIYASILGLEERYAPGNKAAPISSKFTPTRSADSNHDPVAPSLPQLVVGPFKGQTKPSAPATLVDSCKLSSGGGVNGTGAAAQTRVDPKVEGEGKVKGVSLGPLHVPGLFDGLR